MKNLLILCVLVLPLACAKKDKDTSQAEKELTETQKTCDGKGSEFSGVYLVTGDATTGKCTDNEEEVPIPATKFIVDCKQTEADFKCKLVDKGNFSLDGCVNKDGSFHTSASNDLGFLDVSRTVNATKEEKVSKLDGKIEGDDGSGKLTHSSIASRGDQKKGCNISWNVKLEKVGDDNRDRSQSPPPDTTSDSAEVKLAVKNIQESLDIMGGKTKCTGTGTAFSGKYVMNTEEGKISCGDGADETMPPIGFNFDCTQNESLLSCVDSSSSDKIEVKGCVNTDGTFSVATNQFLGSKDEIPEVKEAKGSSEFATILKGNLTSTDSSGSVTAVIKSTVGSTTIGCNAVYSSLKIEKIE